MEARCKSVILQSDSSFWPELDTQGREPENLQLKTHMDDGAGSCALTFSCVENNYCFVSSGGVCLQIRVWGALNSELIRSERVSLSLLE